MAAYILRRLALMIPTILGIMLISLPLSICAGRPVERIIAQLRGMMSRHRKICSGQSEMNNLSGGNFDGEVNIGALKVWIQLL